VLALFGASSLLEYLQEQRVFLFRITDALCSLDVSRVAGHFGALVGLARALA